MQFVRHNVATELVVFGPLLRGLAADFDYGSAIPKRREEKLLGHSEPLENLALAPGVATSRIRIRHDAVAMSARMWDVV